MGFRAGWRLRKGSSEMRLDQKQFEDALAIVSAEWPDDWFANTANDARVMPDDSVVSKAVGIPSSEISADVLAQGFRALFNAVNNSARSGSTPMPADRREKLGIPTPPDAKPIISYLTAKELWGDATHHFSIRDPRTQIGFDVFSGPKGNVHVTSTWKVTA